jgi:hypothetical protein
MLKARLRYNLRYNHNRNSLIEQFRDLIHQLCQEEPAVAQAIARAIWENIPDLSPRPLLKRKWRQDSSYWPSHAVQSAPRKKWCTADQNALDEPLTPDSPNVESEIPENEETLGLKVCLDTDGLILVSTHGNWLDIYSMMLAIDEENTAKSDCNTMSVRNTRQRIQSPPVSEQDPTESVSFLDMVH